MDGWLLIGLVIGIWILLSAVLVTALCMASSRRNRLEGYGEEYHAPPEPQPWNAKAVTR